jgi:hypothetical protein
MLPAAIPYGRIIVKVVASIKEWRAEEVTVETEVMVVKFTSGSSHVAAHCAGVRNKYWATTKVSSTHAGVGAGGGWCNRSYYEYQG